MTKYCLLVSALLSSAAFAQTASAPDAAADPGAAAILVTATRTPTPIDQLASSATVLDAATIRAAQPIDVADLLATTPGVSLSRNGGYGAATSLYIRGAANNQTLLVLDGVKLDDPASPDGSYNFGNLLVNDAARIEVLRGPQSILWGSQAIGGVVNVVTALPTKPFEADASLEGGSRALIDAQAGIGGVSGPLTWRVAGESLSTNGISALDRPFGGREADGYSNRSGEARAILTLASNLSVDLRGYFTHAHTDQDGYDLITFAQADTPEYEINNQGFGYAGVNLALFGGRLKNRFGYSYSETDRDDYDPRQGNDVRSFIARGHDRRFDYEGSLAIAQGWSAVFGVEDQHAHFRSISPAYQTVADGGSADTTGEYLEVNGLVARGLTLSGGVRHDQYSSYGGRWLGSAGAVWALSSGTTIRARYGDGFVAPSLYQLYSEYGDPRLKPATARGWEAGVEQRLLADKIDLSATYFARRTRDEVVFAGTDTPPYGAYLNLARTFAQGVELIGTVKPTARLAITGNYTWTMAEDRSPGDPAGLWLPRRPRHQGNASVSYAWPGGLTTTASVRAVGRSFDDAANLVPLHGYTLLDLRAELPLSPHFTLFARGENLTDERYETAYRYGTLGRSVYAGVRARL